MSSRCCVGSGTVAEGAGGIAGVARLSIRALADGGKDPRIISFLDRGQLSVDGHGVLTCGASKLRFLAEVHRVAATSDCALYDALGVARAHPRWWPRCPAAAWIHGVEAWHGLTPALASSMRRLDFVLSNSNYTLRRHQDMHGALPDAHVCWLATEDDEPPLRLAAFDGPPTALILGRIDATEGLKGHNELLACWPTVVAAVPAARLVIAGGGSGLAGVRSQANASSVARNIEVLGFVASDRIPGLFAQSHVFAMPSRQEGFGIAYVEAMRYGVPCIASRQDGGQEVNIDGATGYNADLDRGGELAERLIALLRNPAQTATFGGNAHRHWRQHFRYSQFAQRFIGLWRQFESTF